MLSKKMFGMSGRARTDDHTSFSAEATEGLIFETTFGMSGRARTDDHTNFSAEAT